MEGYSEAIAVIDGPEAISCEPETLSKAAPAAFSHFSLWTRLLLFTSSIAGYALGAHVGFAVGWLTGFLLGATYVEYFEPAYMSDLSQLSYWAALPCRFAAGCAVVGVIAGVGTIKIAEQRLLRRNIISLRNKGVTDLKVIAHRLAKSEKQIQKIVKKLTRNRRTL